MEIYIFGSSGFSREVADICSEIGYKSIKFIEKNPIVGEVMGIPVIKETEIEKVNYKEIDFAIGVGDPNVREFIFKEYSYLKYPNIIHPTATFGRDMLTSLINKKGNIITAGVRMTNNIELGNFGVFNLNATVGHDCLMDDFVTLSPGANISGNVRLEKNVYIGTGATVLQGKSIDEKLIIESNSTVGAGAVVTKNVGENKIVKGIPAR